MDDCNSESYKSTGSSGEPEPGIIDLTYSSDTYEWEAAFTSTDAHRMSSSVSESDIQITHQWTDGNINSFVSAMYDSESDNGTPTTESKITKESFGRSITLLLERVDEAVTELKDTDLKLLARLVKDHQKKGLFPPRLVSEMKKFTKAKCGKDLDMECYQRTRDVLQNFSCSIEDHRIGLNPFYPKLPKILSFLEKGNSLSLTKEVYLKYLNKNREMDQDLQIRIGVIKKYDTSGIVDLMKALQETGILSMLMLSKFNKLANICVEISIDVDQQNKKMNDIAEHLCKLKCPEVFSNTQFISEYKLENSRNCQNRDLFKVYKSEKQLKTTANEPKKRNCRDEHSLPFCGNCGWRTSWLKAFKKRGVYVKEAVSHTKEHVWHINVN